MDYFIADSDAITRTTITVRDEESKHLVRVLRKSIGDEVFITDGKGTMFKAKITTITLKNVECEIIATLPEYNEPNVHVTLAISLLRNPARMDFVIEKATELGVRKIVPLLSERTVAKSAKVDRYKHLALAAVKQCGRSRCPEILRLTRFEDFLLKRDADALCLIAHELTDRSKHIEDLLSSMNKSNIVLMIGPEGGFSEEEIEKAKASGFIDVSLGARRLRSETAALAALSRIIRG
jgi:16S rRNA (uracil1498-N3)-methyltransferase